MPVILHPWKIPQELSHLTNGDIDKLTGALSTPIWSPFARTALDRAEMDDRARAVARLIDGLPDYLRRPIPMQTRVMNFLGRHFDSIAPACQLCRAHARLNSQLVYFVYAALRLEVGKRLGRLVANMPALSQKHQQVVHKLHNLHALWLPTATFVREFLREPDPKWIYQVDRCGACILARVGADKETLTLLRQALLSRKRSHLAEPRFLRWVEGWIRWSGFAEEIMAESEKDARTLKRARSKLGEGTKRHQRSTNHKLSTILEDENQSTPKRTRSMTEPSSRGQMSEKQRPMAADSSEGKARPSRTASLRPAHSTRHPRTNKLSGVPEPWTETATKRRPLKTSDDDGDQSDDEDFEESIMDCYAPTIYSASRYSLATLLYPGSIDDGKLTGESSSNPFLAPSASAQSRAAEYQALIGTPSQMAFDRSSSAETNVAPGGASGATVRDDAGMLHLISEFRKQNADRNSTQTRWEDFM